MDQCECRKRKMPRSEEEIRSYDNRVNRIIGQLNGIKKMIDENRYCGDILVQIAAVESALQNVGYMLLKDHMDHCVADGIREGNTEIMDEAFELIKKLK